MASTQKFHNGMIPEIHFQSPSGFKLISAYSSHILKYWKTLQCLFNIVQLDRDDFKHLFYFWL